MQDSILKKWANRCVLEAQMWEHNYFITLTYNDTNLPKVDEWIGTDGQTYYDDGSWNGYLNDKHMTKFLKDLRRYYKYHYDHDGIRFYYCGEYGSKTQRPHFHMLAFNLPIDPKELVFYKKTQKGDILYKCPLLEKIWEKGFVVVGEVNWDTCAYTARYIMKKITGEMAKDYYPKRGQTQEFVRMSRMPGIAKQYYELHKDEIYKVGEDKYIDGILLKSGKGEVRKIRPPSYFDNMYDVEYPSDMQRIKQIRKTQAIEAQKVKDTTTSLSRQKQLELEERELREKLKLLKRDL